MKKTIVSMTALVIAFLLACVLPASFAAAENTQETAAQATEAPTEKPKVSAAELQNQGILTVGAKGDRFPAAERVGYGWRGRRGDAGKAVCG